MVDLGQKGEHSRSPFSFLLGSVFALGIEVLLELFYVYGILP